MSIGNPAKAFFLAACLAASGGCDSGAASSQASNTTEWRAPEARYRVDAARHRVWVLTLDGVAPYDVEGEKRIPIALPDWVQVGERYGCMPDLALGPRGGAVVTSNVLPTLWTIDPETLAVTVHPVALDTAIRTRTSASPRSRTRRRRARSSR